MSRQSWHSELILSSKSIKIGNIILIFLHDKTLDTELKLEKGSGLIRPHTEGIHHIMRCYLLFYYLNVLTNTSLLHITAGDANLWPSEVCFISISFLHVWQLLCILIYWGCRDAGISSDCRKKLLFFDSERLTSTFWAAVNRNKANILTAGNK